MDEYLDRGFLEGELHEKIVIRQRRRRRILVSVAFLLFLFLCSIPVYQERLLKWQCLGAARKIAEAIGQMKTESIRLKKPLVLKLTAEGAMDVFAVSSCETEGEAEAATAEKLKSLSWGNGASNLAMMPVEEARKLNLNLVVDRICFDPVTGLSAAKSKKVLVVLPVKDLAESKLDRASYVEVESSTARISIN
jgi:hypothetical protein